MEEGLHLLLQEFLKLRAKGGYTCAPAIDIRVSDGAKKRAVRVMNEVLHALERAGLKISVKERETIAEKDGQKIPFHLEERSRRMENDKPVKPNEYRERYRFIPTGRLSLVIDTYCGTVRRLFQDGARQRVEDVVDEFTEAMLAFIECRRHQQAERIAWEKEHQRRKAEREEERRRVERLQTEIRIYEDSVRVRRYLRLLRRMESSPDQVQWIRWVEGYLGRLQNH